MYSYIVILIEMHRERNQISEQVEAASGLKFLTRKMFGARLYDGFLMYNPESEAQ